MGKDVYNPRILRPVASSYLEHLKILGLCSVSVRLFPGLTDQQERK